MDIGRIKEELIVICKEIKEFDKSRFEDTTKSYRFFYTNNTGVIIDDSSLNAFHNILNILMKDELINTHFSEKYIQKKLDELIIMILNKPPIERLNDLDKDIEGFRENIKKDIKVWSLIFPIVNLSIDTTFTIGDVTFVNFSEEHKTLQDHIFKILNDSKSPLQVIEPLKKQLELQFLDLDKFVCAKVSITGEKIKSIDKGREKVKQALDILRLYAPLNVYSNKCYIGILGELAATNELVLIYNSTEFSHNTESAGFLTKFEITNGYLKVMQDHGLPKLQLFLTNPRNDFQNSLITAIHWFGKSIKNAETKDRFIYFFTALEILLIKDKNESIVTCLRERVAFLLEMQKEKRIELSNNIRYLYDLRSQIVHKGLLEISPKDIKQLQIITQRVILTLLNGKDYNNRDNFFKELEEIKYS